MSYISISLEGDAAFRDAIAVLAKRYRMNTGQFIRYLLMKEYGDDINRELSFFANLHSEMTKNSHNGIENHSTGADFYSNVPHLDDNGV